MAALMNLERTVNDFGHCPRPAKMNYDFPFIAHCVGDSSYTGPCDDDRYVPAKRAHPLAVAAYRDRN